jgi:hypothetical protein
LHRAAFIIESRNTVPEPFSPGDPYHFPKTIQVRLSYVKSGTEPATVGRRMYHTNITLEQKISLSRAGVECLPRDSKGGWGLWLLSNPTKHRIGQHFSGQIRVT